MQNQTYKLKSLNAGKIATLSYGKHTFQSAVKKEALTEPVFLHKTGLTDDEHAYEHHGGEDKALCLYPYDYYAYWRPIIRNFTETALFGENLTVEGLTEEKAHIGDSFFFGEAVIQISEPRNPCYKLAAKYDVPDMVSRMRNTGYTGFLLRVLKEGWVSPNDNLILRELHPGQVSVAFVNDVKFFDRFNQEKLDKVFSVDALSKTLKATLLTQAQHKTINDWA